MRNSAAIYASSVSTDVAAYEDLPGNGTQFTAKKVLEFCDGYHIRVNWVTVAHPQTNDQVERANDIILQRPQAQDLRQTEQVWSKVDSRVTVGHLEPPNHPE
jgi:hypothetical protein